MLQAHETGRSNDTSLSVQMNQTQFLELMRLLGTSRRELNELLPRTGKDKGLLFLVSHPSSLPHPASPSAAFSYDTSTLEAHLLSIAELIESRNKALESLRSAVPDESAVCDRMLERVTSSSGSALTEELREQLIQAELEVFAPSRQSLEASFSRQADLLRQVALSLTCP
jgi:hypothetical protein